MFVWTSNMDQRTVCWNSEFGLAEFGDIVAKWLVLC